MAKVVGPLHSSEARGSVGSLTYNTWRGISIVKARSGPLMQTSAAQIAIRAKTAVATAAWQALTDAQRDAWRDYANTHTDIDWTGNPLRITGYNWYVRINVRRQILGFAIATAPPADIFACHIPLLTMTFIVNRIDFVWDPPDPLPPGQWYFELYAAGPHSAGRHPNIQESLRIGHVAGTNYVYHWMVTAPGTYTAFCRLMHFDGQVSGWHRQFELIP